VRAGAGGARGADGSSSGRAVGTRPMGTKARRRPQFSRRAASPPRRRSPA
jgi:hypothetical protein